VSLANCPHENHRGHWDRFNQRHGRGVPGSIEPASHSSQVVRPESEAKVIFRWGELQDRALEIERMEWGRDESEVRLTCNLFLFLFNTICIICFANINDCVAKEANHQVLAATKNGFFKVFSLLEDRLELRWQVSLSLYSLFLFHSA
jgi:hypothetical protein